MKNKDKLDIIIANQSDLAKAIDKMTYLFDWTEASRKRVDKIQDTCWDIRHRCEDAK